MFFILLFDPPFAIVGGWDPFICLHWHNEGVDEALLS